MNRQSRRAGEAEEEPGGHLERFRPSHRVPEGGRRTFHRLGSNAGRDRQRHDQHQGGGIHRASAAGF